MMPQALLVGGPYHGAVVSNDSPALLMPVRDAWLVNAPPADAGSACFSTVMYKRHVIGTMGPKRWAIYTLPDYAHIDWPEVWGLIEKRHVEEL